MNSKTKDTFKGLAQIAKTFGNPELAVALSVLDDNVGNEITSKFIRGVKNENFEDLINFLPSLHLPSSVLSGVKDLLNSTAIKRIPHDNSDLLQQLEDELNRLREETKILKQTCDDEKIASISKRKKDQQKLDKYNMEAQNSINSEVKDLKNAFCNSMSTILATETPQINEALLFSNPETRDLLIEDEQLKAMAIQLGLLSCENGMYYWKDV